MRILLLGLGNIGKVVAFDLIKRGLVEEFYVADKYLGNLERFNRDFELSIQGYKVDANNLVELEGVLGGFDLVVNALPGRYGIKVVKAAAKVGIDLIDISYMPEDIFVLKNLIEDAGILVVPDAGLAPGLSNILVGRGFRVLDHVNDVKIYVGGLPIEKTPPLDYVITWSADDLVDEYMRPPKVVIEGSVKVVKPLSGLEEFSFEGVGVLEAFYTDGLRTLLHTFKRVRNMWEKTLRYPGHLEKIVLLRSLGLFSDDWVDGVMPRDFLVRLLNKRLGRSSVPDQVILRVILRSEAEKTILCNFYEAGFDEYGFSAMARSTGYVASSIVSLYLKRCLKERGIFPPEYIGLDDDLFNEFKLEFNDRNLYFSEELIG